MPRKKPDLDALIDAMVRGDRTVEYEITKLGAKAVPALVRAMDDPRACQKTRWGPAIMRIWEKLIFRATPEIIARMAEFVDHPDPEIRRNLYGNLAWYGSSACGEALIRAWRTHGDDDRQSIFNWVRHQATATRERLEPGFIAALYEVIFERLSVGDLGTFYEVAIALLKLDPPRGQAYLTAPERFRADKPEVLGILIALRSAECLVPAAKLIPMLPALRAWSDAADEGGPPGAPYEVALLLLARSDPKSARPLVEEALRSDDDFRRERAGEALEIIEEIDNALGVAQAAVGELDVEDDGGGIDVDLIEDTHANYFLAHLADEVIRNEGLNSYLLETPDGHVARTPEALEAIGAARAAESVRQARALVRKLKPRKGEDSPLAPLYRPEVVARIAELQAPFLEPRPGEEIPGLLRLYALQHADDFRPAKKRKRRR